MQFEAEFRKVQRNFNRTLGIDELGNLLVSKGLPDYARLCAGGRLFAINMHAGTAIAPVVAPPTTSPEWLLYNASPTDTLILLQAACFLKSGTAGLGLSMMAAAALGPQTVVEADYTGTIKTCLDGSKKIPDVYLANNQTLVGGTPAWAVLDATKVNSVATDSVGDGLVSRVDGLFCARPNGGGIALALVGETGTTALFTVSMIFAMLPLELY